MSSGSVRRDQASPARNRPRPKENAPEADPRGVPWKVPINLRPSGRSKGLFAGVLAVNHSKRHWIVIACHHPLSSSWADDFHILCCGRGGQSHCTARRRQDCHCQNGFRRRKSHERSHCRVFPVERRYTYPSRLSTHRPGNLGCGWRRSDRRTVSIRKRPRRSLSGGVHRRFELTCYSDASWKVMLNVTRAPTAAPSTSRGDTRARRAPAKAAWPNPAPGGSSAVIWQSVIEPFGLTAQFRLTRPRSIPRDWARSGNSTDG